MWKLYFGDGLGIWKMEWMAPNKMLPELLSIKALLWCMENNEPNWNDASNPLLRLSQIFTIVFAQTAFLLLCGGKKLFSCPHTKEKSGLGMRLTMQYYTSMACDTVCWLIMTTWCSLCPLANLQSQIYIYNW